MSVLVLVENWKGKLKKSSFESLSYAKKISDGMSVKCIALTLNCYEAETLKKYGADKIVNFTNISFEETTNTNISQIVESVANEEASKIIIFSNTINGKAIVPVIANKLKFGLITNAIESPESLSPLQIKCKAFSSKSFVKYQSGFEKNIISIVPNSIGNATQIDGDGELLNITFDTSLFEDKIKLIEQSKQSEKISLSDAELVVSAGRGLKNAENWTMIEDLANSLGAATACSKPVSDMGWRPHSEHVGQTGLAINPDLYIAIGISGAIQHLAGVNSSKNIVVINTDPDAPFFQAANYGIIGDAFIVVPKLIKLLKDRAN